MIQDAIYSVCMAVFVIAMVPQVLDGFRRRVGTVSLWTSVPTALTLCVLAVTVGTTGYVYGCVMQAVCAALWFELAFQRIAFGPPPPAES